MSQIFDALQRSESERSGKDGGTELRATEVLQRAERDTFTGRSSTLPADAWTTPLANDSAVAVAEPNREPVAVSTVLRTAAPAERVDGPSQCEVLSVRPPVGSHLVSVLDSESPAGEAFHLLGVRLRHMRRQRPLKKVLITSSIPQEGKSLTAANLACTLALRTQQKVLLLEGDVRRPTQSKIFGLPNKPGICEWLNGERAIVKSMYKLDGPGIWILPAGQATGESLDLLQSGRAIPLMEQLTDWFDWVVIDSPPILPLADTSVWTNLADGILLVARQGTTQKRQLKRGLEALGNQRVIGAVLNSAKGISHADYYYRPDNRLPTDDAEG
ncbi:tyrosine-protein kinase family protein [Occallatibacter savannae]|uniref:tyrosine-protein kinase family protein n=1 Tax=Occallatibacter savannae TaxID=1002691 RepID=UPI0013A59D39|nr:CpsD/CapB family tyrosine-protein kinase [Occallatibacter savannae]